MNTWTCSFPWFYGALQWVSAHCSAVWLTAVRFTFTALAASCWAAAYSSWLKIQLQMNNNVAQNQICLKHGGCQTCFCRALDVQFSTLGVQMHAHINELIDLIEFWLINASICKLIQVTHGSYLFSGDTCTLWMFLPQEAKN